jgi:hypothetical protein
MTYRGTWVPEWGAGGQDRWGKGSVIILIFNFYLIDLKISAESSQYVVRPQVAHGRTWARDGGRVARHDGEWSVITHFFLSDSLGNLS